MEETGVGFFKYVFFLAKLSILCNCAKLQVLINGQTGRSTACVGENLTYVCTLETVTFGHYWSIPGIDSQIVLLDILDITVMGFTLRSVQEVDDILSTSVSVTAYSELNGTVIECREAIFDVEVQNTTVLVDGSCTQLEVLIDGQVGRTSSCVGENVTYVCNLASSSHIWNIPGVAMEHSILANSPFVQTIMGFTFRKVHVSDGILTSSVSVISYPGLDDTVIGCVDGVQRREVHNITASVYCPPLTPEVTIVQDDVDFTAVNLIIHPPADGPQCITAYTITTNRSDDPGVNVTVDAPTSPVSHTLQGFDVCDFAYSFTIIPHTLSGDGSSVVVNELSGGSVITGLRTTTSGLVWSEPTNAMGCSFQYIITLAADPNVTHTVDTNSVSFSDLRANGFPICVTSVITVTPRMLTSNTLLSNSSATIGRVVVSSGNITIPDASIDVDELTIRINWIIQVVGITAVETVHIQQTSSDGLEVDVASVAVTSTEGQYLVELNNCSYVGKRLAFYVLFMSGDCTSDVAIMITDELVKEECQGVREDAVVMSLGTSESAPAVLALPLSTLLIGFLL